MKNKNFSRLANGIIIFNVIIIVIVTITVTIVGYNLITHPESVGEFFGKIVNGFKSVK